MTVKFVESEKGTSLIINEEEITYYFKEEQISDSGRVSTVNVCAHDFELDTDEINKLLILSNAEIPECFYLYKEKYTKIEDGYISICIDNEHVSLRVEHELDSWTNQYKYTDFLESYTKSLSKSPFLIRPDLTLNLGFDESYEDSMLPQVMDALKWLNKCYIETQNILNEKTQNDVFTKLFDFPHEYKNICSQYLIWFGEFLKNLNINANVSTEQTGNQMKLIIAPDDCPELLGKIESLFYQYLTLPYAELLPPEASLTPQELHAYQSAVMQVQHLQTQMQMKDSVIASYQATNSNLINQIREKATQPTLLNSLKDENKYKLFGGLLEVSRKQTIGKNGNVSIDLSTISRFFNKIKQ